MVGGNETPTWPYSWWLVCVKNIPQQIITASHYCPGGEYRTVQIISRAINFVDFAVSLQRVKIISAKMEQMPIVTWLNYACDPQNLFSVKSKF